MRRIGYFILTFCLAGHSQAYAHPGGNMIVVQDVVLWSYVDPLDDPEHHACIMIWKLGEEPRMLMRSVYPASDYMLAANGTDIYIIESRYIHASDRFEARILKMKIGQPHTEIWGWMKDQWHIGQGGFYMPTDDQIVFASYPNVYRMRKNTDAQIFLSYKDPVRTIRKVEQERLLILCENSCKLTSPGGQPIREWSDLVDPNVRDAPLQRNQVFDVDYEDGQLLLAYWGKRSFELIDQYGERSVIVQHSTPLVPHWVAFGSMGKLLFASELSFDGTNPQPKLLLLPDEGETREIWSR